MRAIWKFPLPIRADEALDVQMPVGAQVVRFGLQGSVPTLWALVDTQAQLAARRFAIIGTGHDFPDDAVYVGSFDSPPFVWHVVEHRPGGQDMERPWHTWSGGDCPVPSPTVVEYEQRDGQVLEAPGGVLDWNRDDEHPQPWDILRYRQAVEQPGA